jgi:hypothetical protein
MKAKEDKLRARWAKFDAEQQKLKADRMKAYEEKRVVKRKTNQENTYQIREDRTYRVVIRNLHHSVTLDERN